MQTIELDLDQVKRLFGDHAKIYYSENGDLVPGRSVPMSSIHSDELSKLYPGTLQIDPASTEGFQMVFPNVLPLNKHGEIFVPGLEIGGITLTPALYSVLGLPYEHNIGVATGCWETFNYDNNDYLGFRYTWPKDSSHFMLILNCFSTERHLDVLRQLPSFVQKYKATFVGYIGITDTRTAFYLVIPNNQLGFTAPINAMQDRYAQKAQS